MKRAAARERTFPPVFPTPPRGVCQVKIHDQSADTVAEREKERECMQHRQIEEAKLNTHNTQIYTYRSSRD